MHESKKEQGRNQDGCVRGVSLEPFVVNRIGTVNALNEQNLMRSSSHKRWEYLTSSLLGWPGPQYQQGPPLSLQGCSTLLKVSSPFVESSTPLGAK